MQPNALLGAWPLVVASGQRASVWKHSRTRCRTRACCVAGSTQRLATRIAGVLQAAPTAQDFHAKAGEAAK
jgi:hypothetical protein